MAADQAAAVAAEQPSDLCSEGAKTAKEAASSQTAKVDAAVLADIVPKPAAQAGHVDAAVQVVCPEQGQILSHLYGMSHGLPASIYTLKPVIYKSGRLLHLKGY